MCDITSLWNIEAANAFEKLKLVLTSGVLLAYPDFSKPFLLETDACNKRLGAVLSQIQDDTLKVIAYASRGPRNPERKSGYSSQRIGLLALKWAICDKFRDYLTGAKFSVVTDNNPLTYVMTKSKIPALEQRWINELASFDFTLLYRQGKHIYMRIFFLDCRKSTLVMAQKTCNITSKYKAFSTGTAIPNSVKDLALGSLCVLVCSTIVTPSAQNNLATSFPPWTADKMVQFQKDDPVIAW